MVENGQWAIMKCQGQGVTNESGRTQHYSGLLCGVLGKSGWASDSHATVTKNGNATLTCKMPVGG
jgi:hypothetical protein